MLAGLYVDRSYSTNTYFVSSCIRLVSTGWSDPSAGLLILMEREGGGLSGGFGWVIVNGNSTAKSLLYRKHQISQCDIYS